MDGMLQLKIMEEEGWRRYGGGRQEGGRGRRDGRVIWDEGGDWSKDGMC